MITVLGEEERGSGNCDDSKNMIIFIIPILWNSLILENYA